MIIPYWDRACNLHYRVKCSIHKENSNPDTVKAYRQAASVNYVKKSAQSLSQGGFLK